MHLGSIKPYSCYCCPQLALLFCLQGKGVAYERAAHVRVSHMWLGYLPVMVLAGHSCNAKGVQGGEAMHAVCLHIAMTDRHGSLINQQQAVRL